MTSRFRQFTRSSTLLTALCAASIALLIAPAAQGAERAAPAACATLAGSGASARPERVADRDVCAVAGHDASGVEFSLKLPLAEWNGKFAQLSCAGSCPGSLESLCDNLVRRGFACLAIGRTKKPFSSNDISHALALRAKERVGRLYGKPATTSLFFGCGEGGHDALVEAQRFPQDFNVIVASAPIMEPAAFAQDLRWRIDSLGGRGGRPKLTMDDLQRLHRAAVAKCDADDGLQDGLIGQPLRCGFDPKSVVCGSTPDAQCITAAAAGAAARIYAGAPDAKASSGAVAGLLPGSELAWAAFIKPDADLLRLSAKGGTAAAASADAVLDLSAFVAARGKLILVQGMADPLVSPRRVVRSYELLARSMGGLVQTQGAVRLYAVAGMGHCGGGEGANRLNLLSVAETWAAGRAADDMIAFRALDPSAPAHPFAPAQLDPAQTVYGGWMLGNPVSLEQAQQLSGTALSRPVFLYPYRTQYKGRGDPKLWMSFFAPGDFSLLSN